MKQSLPVIEAHDFATEDFVAGDPALDFVNTVTARDSRPRDWLDGYPRLLEWAGHAALVPDKVLRTLARRAKSDPAAAKKALARAKQLREALYEILEALVWNRVPPVEATALMRKHWLEGAEAHHFHFHEGRLARHVHGDTADLDLIAGIIAWRMVEHVLPTPSERLRLCSGPECSWLFVDRSKAGRRRWCDMAVCGNAAKSRRHYAKERSKS